MPGIIPATVGEIAQGLDRNSAYSPLDHDRLGKQDHIYAEAKARVLLHGVRVFGGDREVIRTALPMEILPLMKPLRLMPLPLPLPILKRRIRIFNRLACRPSYNSFVHAARSPWISQDDLIWLKLVTR